MSDTDVDILVFHKRRRATRLHFEVKPQPSVISLSSMEGAQLVLIVTRVR